MRPNWRPHLNKNNTNNFFFYNPKISVCPHLLFHNDNLNIWFNAVFLHVWRKKVSNKVIRLSCVTAQECWRLRCQGFFGVLFFFTSDSGQAGGKKGGEHSTRIHPDTTHIFKIRIIKQKNRFRYVMAWLFLHRFFTHDFTERKKNSVHTRGTGSWGKKQKLQEGRYFTSQPEHAHHKNGIFHYSSSRTETRPTHQCKAEVKFWFKFNKSDLCTITETSK